MSKTEIRGNKQIKDLSITNAQIESNAGIETSKLAEGQELLKRDGSVPLTDDLNAAGNKIENLVAPVGDNDAARKVDFEEADLVLQDNLDEQISARQSSDEALDLRADSVEIKDVEQDNRIQVVESDIDQLQIDVPAEESARIAADIVLQNQINEAVAGQFISGEIPSGSINGVNKIFSLSNIPNLDSEQIYLNGILQNKGIDNDYTISGNTITLSVAPIVGENILVNYIHNAIVLTPAGGVDLTPIQNDILAIQNDITIIDGRLDIIEPEIDALQNESSSFDSRLDILETSGGSGDLTQIQNDITALEGRLTVIESDVDTSQVDVISLDSRLDSIETTVSDLSTVATTGSYNDLLDKPVAGGMNVDWQYFSSSGTWTKPAGAKLVYVICVSGGGGGGSGNKTFDAIRYGGSGGAGGAAAAAWFNASQLSSTETVTVGLGGNGGNGIAFGAGAGTPSNGSAGGASYFGGNSFPACKLGSEGNAAGGIGSGIQNETAASGTNTPFTIKSNPGARGRPADNSVQNGADAIFYEIGAGGGASGGSVSRNSPHTTTLGGNRNLLERNYGYIINTSAGYSIDPNTGGQTAGANGSTGLNAITDGSSPYIFGGGGAGGAASVDSTSGSSGGNGGNGGTPGGGGGGGGSGLFGSTGAGAGGSGGNGGVYVITYF